MRVLDVRPLRHHGSGTFRDFAIFDVQVNEGLRLVGLRLARAPDGRQMVFAPSKHGRKFATFSREFAEEIIEAVTAAFKGRDTNDQYSR